MTPMVASVSSQLTDAIGNSAVIAVLALMAIDAVLPIGGELIMLYAGVVAAGAISGADVSLFGTKLASGLASFLTLVAAGTLGYMLGALAGFAVGRLGGRPLLERHGRWLHLPPQRLDRAERWFERHRGSAVLLGRLTPIVRSFISVPAGVFRVPLGRYSALTLLASLIWCVAFAAAGWAAGANWQRVHHAFGYVEIVFATAIVAALAVAVVLLVRNRSRRPDPVRARRPNAP